MSDAAPGMTSGGRAGDVLERIRSESRDQSEKGLWFERLFMAVALQEPELEIDAIWRWPDWPDRERVTGLDGRDPGVDLVARRRSGELIAVQCKCYGPRYRVGKPDIDAFLGGSQNGAFRLRWIVATCPWGPNAERAILNASPPVSQIDFRRFHDVEISEKVSERPVREPWPLQREAIDDVVDGFANHDRGRLVMACGTGKTFTSLRIAERIVPPDGSILFAAPSIALVAQARREWLRLTTRSLECLVVCSDRTAGGRGEEDMRISELECPVTTAPEAIAGHLAPSSGTRAVFCTYQSLGQVIEAQGRHAAPAFDLAIADEAHRTTGAVRVDRPSKVDFQAFHDDERLHARKRLYMTATPRLYSERSKGGLAARGIEVVDMGDQDVYGPEFHRLPFARAVDAGMLSDYRVIVLGVSQAAVTPGLRRRLEALEGDQVPTTSDMTRVLGASLAINGMTVGGSELERPDRLSRTMAFANSIRRSKWYVRALTEREVLGATTRRLRSGGRNADAAMKVEAVHLDASDSALRRNQALQRLGEAGETCRVVSNVRLFTEGVDLPTLDAVAFLDPRESQIDVVQAVGRVMRRAPGKRFGYIIVPVVVPRDGDILSALANGTEGYRTIGRVLRALQAHDGRLAEDTARFVRVLDTDPGIPPDDRTDGDWPGRDAVQGVLDLREAEQAVYAHVAAASGLGRPGQIVADEIAGVVRHAGAIFESEQAHSPLAAALDLAEEDDGGARGVSIIAALMICNACLLQRRLREEPGMEAIPRLDRVAGAVDPAEALATAWDAILERDYAPVFRPALAALLALPRGRAVANAIRMIAECANRIAAALSDLGLDHAGPLYHRILGSAKSDGAFYTNNISALLLSRLAFTDDMVDWSDPKAISDMRVMDPACGTGTLLMAALHAIKAHSRERAGEGEFAATRLHRTLVEDVLCGLDINQHAVQLAACSMTLGAPTVDYARMNLVTMPHGPQEDGGVKAGSLEILDAADDVRDLWTMRAPQRSFEFIDAEQVSDSPEICFRLHDLDAVIMNAPFTDNRKRNRKFGAGAVKRMQAHELAIRNSLEQRDPAAADVITSNSIRTFFTPLADRLLHAERGVLAKVVPVTACTGASGLAERRFLAERFHVERVVTTHDPKKIAFSENTGIHESLLVCRRHASSGSRPPTEFVSLRQMPQSAEEAVAAAEAILNGRTGDWGRVCQWPADRVAAGNWTPAQWYDDGLAEIAWLLEGHQHLQPASHILRMGPTGRTAQDSWKRVADGETASGALRVFDSVSADLRQTMLAAPEQAVAPGGRREHLYERVLKGRGHLLLSTRYDTVAGRVTALFSEAPAFGFGWIPATGSDRGMEKALCAWWNSTPGRILLLNRRAKKLTYPKWSVDHLTSIPCPRPGGAGSTELADAWLVASREPLLPLRQAEACKARRIIDAAAAKVLGIDEDVMADWRSRLSTEPTVTNRLAEVSYTWPRPGSVGAEPPSGFAFASPMA